MKLITRTFGGSYLQSTQLPQLAFKLNPFTTLNEKFAVQADQIPAVGQMPGLGMFCIGNGGHSFAVGANGIAKPSPIQHQADHAALYNHLPFVLREPSNDLTLAQMAKYRLRVPVTVNGTAMIAYYAKKLDFTGIFPQMEFVTKNEDGSSNVTPFVPSSANLNPTPPDLSPSGVNVATGSYVVVSVKVPLTMTAEDVAEFLNVANLMYGDPELAIISEIALCSGIDKTVQGGGNGQPTFQYKESIATQVNSIFNSFYAMAYADDGIDVLLDIGATEPLLKLTNQSA